MPTRLFSFIGGDTGPWQVAAMNVVAGEALPAAKRLAIAPGADAPSDAHAAWWALTQDQRQDVFEEQSSHARLGLRHFPALARRLHHCRDLSENEPFDFITWFEYSPADAAAFDELVAALRATEEWKYVEREVDIRLLREAAAPLAAT